MACNLFCKSQNEATFYILFIFNCSFYRIYFISYLCPLHTLYVFIPTNDTERPMKPVITGNSPVLPGNSLTLKCSANLLSSPPEFQDPDSLRYSWGGSATGATSTITLGSLDKTNNGDVVTCTAIDDGASESLRSEATNVTIMVYCEFIRHMILMCP